MNLNRLTDQGSMNRDFFSATSLSIGNCSIFSNTQSKSIFLKVPVPLSSFPLGNEAVANHSSFQLPPAPPGCEVLIVAPASMLSSTYMIQFFAKGTTSTSGKGRQRRAALSCIFWKRLPEAWFLKMKCTSHHISAAWLLWGWGSP